MTDSRKHPAPDLRPLDAAQIRRLLTPALKRRIRQLYVRRSNIKIVLTDGSTLLATCGELGVDTARLARLSNRATIDVVVDRLVDWGRRAGDGWLLAGSVHGARLFTSVGALSGFGDDGVSA